MKVTEITAQEAKERFLDLLKKATSGSLYLKNGGPPVNITAENEVFISSDGEEVDFLFENKDFGRAFVLSRADIAVVQLDFDGQYELTDDNKS